MSKSTKESNPTMSSKLSHLKVPHGFVLVFSIIVLAWLLTYILPAGEFQRTKVMVGDTMRSVLVPGTYQVVASNPASPMDLATAFYRGLIEAADVVFLVFFAYSCFHLVLRTGALDCFIRMLLTRVRGKEWAFIIVFSFIFSLGGSMLGMLSEFYGFIPIFISLAIAMGYDSIVGFSVVNLSSHIGFAAATTNPFTVGVAQIISEVPLFSGLEFRFICWFLFTSLSTLYILWYARRIKKDPTKSIMAGVDTGASDYKISEDENEPITKRCVLVLVIVLVSMSTLVYGTLQYQWGMTQIVGLFFTMAVFSGFASGWSPDRIAMEFIDGCKGIVYGALITGMARGILVILQKGKIIDTVMYYLSNLLDGSSPWLAVQGMLIVQTIVNFFIPSGSGQAATTMPIMSGLSDLVGVSRQTAILAFQFGDGFANLLWPTCGIVVTCALAKIPLDRWWRYFLPLFGILYLVQVAVLTVALYINFQ